MTLQVLFLVLAVTLLSSCAKNASSMDRISVGMTKADVVRTLGEPVGTGVRNGWEYLEYRMPDRGWMNWESRPYTIVLQDGRVVTYGRKLQEN
jgi:hypothetical protein